MVDNFSFLAVVMSYCHCHFIVYSNIKHETCIPFHTSEFYSFPTDLNLSAVSLQILMINISPASCHLTLRAHHQTSHRRPPPPDGHNGDGRLSGAVGGFIYSLQLLTDTATPSFSLFSTDNNAL